MSFFHCVNIRILFVLVCFLCFEKAFSNNERTLVGDLPQTLDSEKGAYLVTSDIYVPAGKTVTIQAGTVLLFKNFTGLHVQGTLIVNGSSEKPVVFTSENDQTCNPVASLSPNPYDWNGIFIHEDAIGTSLKHFSLLYSVYGINSQTKFILIDKGLFRDNGRANVTIEGLPKTVTTEPFSYSVSVKNALVDGVPVKILSDPEVARIRWNTLRIGSAILFVTGSVIGAVFTAQTLSAHKKIADVGNDKIYRSSSEFEAAKKDRNTKEAYMISGYVLGLFGATGVFISFRY